MEELDIRWHQRFKNYSDAVDRLNEASELLCQKDIAPRERTLMSEGLIQRFEFTQELAWKVMKDYEEYQGYTDIAGSRDAIRIALEIGLIDNRAWMETIRDRNNSSHSYDEDTAMELIKKIQLLYARLFTEFKITMQTKL
ncbi:MAG: nucleotidyltransferase substrate binding protein [Paludibacteraceae bacterium]|nr:nucleotidyltransferase substrate binding protein [Paludibacteraceae bacterium]